MKTLQDQLNDLKIYKEKHINDKVRKVEQVQTKTTSTYERIRIFTLSIDVNIIS